MKRYQAIDLFPFLEHFSGSDFGVKTKKYFFSVAKATVEKYFNVLAQKRPAKVFQEGETVNKAGLRVSF